LPCESIVVSIAVDDLVGVRLCRVGRG